MIPSVNLVCKRDGWLMSRLINEFLENYPNVKEGDPTSEVDINYFFPYYAYKGYNKTKTAAMFTHREEHSKFQHRRNQWDRTAKEVDLRIPMSKTYAKILKNPKTVIELPITKKFKSKKYVIGLSGRLYKSDRKGRDLLDKIYNHPVSNYIEFKFAGKGWPDYGEVKRYKFEDMGKFYRKLDYFLCTSTVEGGPMPVKEAAFCGVRVIAPKNVGFCEEYADYLYEKGSVNQLIKTLSDLVKPKVSYEQVNVNYWIKQHIEAFNELRF
jgi:glycosyltransferase involved in cell wall biosynthesis